MLKNKIEKQNQIKKNKKANNSSQIRLISQSCNSGHVTMITLWKEIWNKL